MTELMIDYYEGLHKRRQQDDIFLVDKELDFIEDHYCDRHVIDCMLCLDATLHMDIDIDSSKTFRDNVKKQSRLVYRRIKKIDKKLGEQLITFQD